MLHASAFQHERFNLLFRIGVVLFFFLGNKPFPEERLEVKLYYKHRMLDTPRVLWFVLVYTEILKYGSLHFKWMFSHFFKNICSDMFLSAFCRSNQ
jgi:hypothetical protein